ncbi:MAG: GNAT family N-acetyltransferase [Clostridia bacterium]|nr:GNAT family N-acetyltransferase [Clostridia bacterium]
MTQIPGTGSAEPVCIRKRFDELTLAELYRLLRLRVSVFVVEQGCPYQEVDDRDQGAVHVFLQDGEEMIAYLRVMDRGVESPEVSIGRVISTRRHQGLGSRILREGIRTAVECFHADRIYLEAQTQACPFYERQGFQVVSGEFDLDGIPHVRMILDCLESVGARQ